MSIVITTESCSDLTKELMDKHNIRIIPMHMVFDDKTFPDGTIPVEYIYDYFARTKKVPKTSAVNPEEFKEFFEDITRQNPGVSIIHISYSSQASCTYQNAVIGLEACNGVDVTIIDSKNVSGGACNVTLTAARLLRENPKASVEELVKMIEGYVDRTATYFVPDRLEYLVAGGRVSNAMALTATILRIKPRIDIIDGRLVATKKYRGSMNRVAKHFVKDFIEENDLEPDSAYIMYAKGADEKTVELMTDMLKDYGFREVVVVTTGCVMTTHGGPGAIGLSGTRKAK